MRTLMRSALCGAFLLGAAFAQVSQPGGGVGSSTADQLDAAMFCSDVGANDTYACNLSPAITIYTTGNHYKFKANTANTGAATINFNSLGAKTIKKFTSASPGADLADNDIRAGQWVDVVYDGTNMQMVGLLGNAASSLSGLTTNAFMAAASATTAATPSATSTLDSSGNAAFVGTVSIGSSPPACTAGTAGAQCWTEGTAFTNVASTAGLYPDSTAHEFVAKTNGASTGGILVRAQPSAVNLTGQTATKSISTLCAAAAGACNVAGQYHVHFNFWGSGTACSSVTAGSVTFALTWVDENAVTHSAVIIPMLNQTGATSVAIGNSFLFATNLANEGASGDFTISTNGSVIQYTATYIACTTGTGTYNLRATATRLQ